MEDWIDSATPIESSSQDDDWMNCVASATSASESAKASAQNDDWMQLVESDDWLSNALHEEAEPIDDDDDDDHTIIASDPEEKSPPMDTRKIDIEIIEQHTTRTNSSVTPLTEFMKQSVTSIVEENPCATSGLTEYQKHSIERTSGRNLIGKLSESAKKFLSTTEIANDSSFPTFIGTRTPEDFLDVLRHIDDSSLSDGIKIAIKFYSSLKKTLISTPSSRKIEHALAPLITGDGLVNLINTVDTICSVSDKNIEEMVLCFEKVSDYLISCSSPVIDEAIMHFICRYLQFIKDLDEMNDYLNLQLKNELENIQIKRKSHRGKSMKVELPRVFKFGFIESVRSNFVKFLESSGLNNDKKFIDMVCSNLKVTLQEPAGQLRTQPTELMKSQRNLLAEFFPRNGKGLFLHRGGTGSGKTTMAVLLAQLFNDLSSDKSYDGPKRVIFFSDSPAVRVMVASLAEKADLKYTFLGMEIDKAGSISSNATQLRIHRWNAYQDMIKKGNTQNWFFRNLKKEFKDIPLNTKVADLVVRYNASTRGVISSKPDRGYHAVGRRRHGFELNKGWGGKTIIDDISDSSQICLFIAQDGESLADFMCRVIEEGKSHEMTLVLDDWMSVTCRTTPDKLTRDTLLLGSVASLCPESTILMCATLPTFESSTSCPSFLSAYKKQYPTSEIVTINPFDAATGTAIVLPDGSHFQLHTHCKSIEDISQVIKTVKRDTIMQRFGTASVCSSLYFTLQDYGFLFLKNGMSLSETIMEQISHGRVLQTFWTQLYIDILEFIISDVSPHVSNDVLIEILSKSTIHYSTLPMCDDDDYDVAQIIANNMLLGGCLVATIDPKRIAYEFIPQALASRLSLPCSTPSEAITSIITRMNAYYTAYAQYFKGLSTHVAKATKDIGGNRDGEMGSRKISHLNRKQDDAINSYSKEEPEHPITRSMSCGKGPLLMPSSEWDKLRCDEWIKFLLTCRIALIWKGMDEDLRNLIFNLVETGEIGYFIADEDAAFGMDVPCSCVVILKDFDFSLAALFQVAGRAGRLGKESQGSGKVYGLTLVKAIQDVVNNHVEDQYVRDGDVLNEAVHYIHSDASKRLVVDRIKSIHSKFKSKKQKIEEELRVKRQSEIDELERQEREAIEDNEMERLMQEQDERDRIDRSSRAYIPPRRLISPYVSPQQRTSASASTAYVPPHMRKPSTSH